MSITKINTLKKVKIIFKVINTGEKNYLSELEDGSQEEEEENVSHSSEGFRSICISIILWIRSIWRQLSQHQHVYLDDPSCTVHVIGVSAVWSCSLWCLYLSWVQEGGGGPACSSRRWWWWPPCHRAWLYGPSPPSYWRLGWEGATTSPHWAPDR